MDQDRFDDLARTVAGSGTRRAMLRRLAGGALGALVAGLGLSEATAQEQTEASHRCRNVGGRCEQGDRCCAGAVCRGGRCDCRGGRKRCGNRCIRDTACCTGGRTGCATNQTCINGACVSTICRPNCTDKQCGADGCGGSCGTCAVGRACSADGRCLPTCRPSCGRRQCGPDGCGGSCGTCRTGRTCTAAGFCEATPR